MSYSWCVIL